MAPSRATWLLVVVVLGAAIAGTHGQATCAEALERELAARREARLPAPAHHEILPTLRVAAPENSSDVRIVWYVPVSELGAIKVVQTTLEHLYVPQDAYLVHAHPQISAQLAEQLRPAMAARVNMVTLEWPLRGAGEGGATHMSPTLASVEGTLDAVRAVLRSGLVFDFFVPLHQSELPTRPLHELRALLAELRGHSLVPVAHTRAPLGCAEGEQSSEAALELADVVLDCAGEGVLLASAGAWAQPRSAVAEGAVRTFSLDRQLTDEEVALLAPPPPAAVFESSLARLSRCAPSIGGCETAGGGSGAGSGAGGAGPCERSSFASQFGLGAFLSPQLCAALVAPAPASAAAAHEAPRLALAEWLRALEHRPRGVAQLLASAAVHLAEGPSRRRLLNLHLRTRLGGVVDACGGQRGESAECAARAEAVVRAALASPSAAFAVGVPTAPDELPARTALLRAHGRLLARALAPPSNGTAAAEPLAPPVEPPVERAPLLGELRLGGADALTHRLRLRGAAELAAAGRPQPRGRRRRVAALHFSDGSSCACGGACATDASCCPPQFALACASADGGTGAAADEAWTQRTRAEPELPPLPRCANATASLRARTSDARPRRLQLHNGAHFPAVVRSVDEAGAEAELATLAPGQALSFDCAAGDALRARAVAGWVLLEVWPAGPSLGAKEERHEIRGCEGL